MNDWERAARIWEIRNSGSSSEQELTGREKQYLSMMQQIGQPAHDAQGHQARYKIVPGLTVQTLRPN
jgi:hypothetical protein